ncbi:HAMP domain-containing protein [Mobilitalea sibirica]|uniref:HAMP domain-containing protein n=1 Tax=Mobilitalea sibirica TaxID=1462919 RepID=A0A8J7HDW0_9FIRM|nr:HAMP domain-containing methyl-accepting chemotaxis protein [Mobilitalea sibirica]MBH1942562.1 HAMP domain-containing protein [Mobilitalea sibirica]
MDNKAQQKNNILTRSMNDLLTFNFLHSITFKMIIVITVTFMFSAPVAQTINNYVQRTGLVSGNIGAYINTFINMLVINLIIVFFMYRLIIKPLKKHIKVLREIGEGNLSENVSVNGKDEFSKLAKATNLTINHLNELIGEVQKSAHNTDTTTSKLEDNLKDIKLSTYQIGVASEEISKRAEMQANIIEDGSKKAEQLSDVIEKNKHNMTSLNEISLEINHLVSEGLDEIEKLAKTNNESILSIRDISLNIDQMNDSASKIGEASNIITSISKTTNLLALNASMEAARAGEAGRGFAVVAENVKKLAEQSAASTQRIDEIVNEIQYASKNAVNAMERVTSISDVQSSAVKISKGKYETISTAIKKTEDIVGNLNISSDSMACMKDDIIQILNSFTAIAQENTASTQEVAASIGEQTSAIEKITDMGEKLSLSTEELSSKVKEFDV